MRRISKAIFLLFISVILISCGKKSYVVFNYNCNGREYHKCELKDNKINCYVDTPTCSGYKFKGWYRANEYKTTVDLNGTFNVNEIIYARWEKGSEEPSSSEEQVSTIITPTPIDMPSSSSNVEYSSQIVDEPSSQKPTPVPEATYTISFNLNGGSGGQSQSISGVKYGDSLPAINQTKPAKGGYIFAGWYDSKEGGTQYYNSSNSPVRKYDKKSNINLYAHFNACQAGTYATSGATSCTACTGNTYTSSVGQTSCKACETGYTVNSTHTGCNGEIYTVTLNNQSATSTGTSTIYLKYGTGWYANAGGNTTITSITKPTKIGYAFGGYYTSTNGGGTQIISASGAIIDGKTKVFNSNITLYAKWTPYVLSIEYNGNGGTWISTNSNYGVNSSGTVIVKSTGEVYLQKVNYGAKLESSGLTDYNGSWFKWKKDGHIVESKKEYILKSTALDQNKVYAAIDLAKSGGCDLSKNDCKITVKVNWKKGQTIRLASFNVGYFACGSSKISCSPTNDQFVSLLTDNKIDIVGTQEARNNGYNTNRIEAIGEKSGLKNKYISKPANINAILSKYAFESKTTTFMSCGERRALDKVVIKINGIDISYYNTHLGLRTCNTEHFEKVAEILSQDPNPIIITGDYNHIYTTKFEKYFMPLGFEFAAYDTSTNNMWGKPSYCDAVLINSKGHIDAIGSKTVEAYAKYSDHNLVYADLFIH